MNSVAAAVKAASEQKQAIDDQSAAERRKELEAEYAQILLSGDTSEAAVQRIAALRDEMPDIDVLADECAATRARLLMKLYADREHARASATGESRRLAEVRYASERAVRAAQARQVESVGYDDRCRASAKELTHLAENHPHLFQTGSDGVPRLKHADAEQAAADARLERERTRLRFRLSEAERNLAAADHSMNRGRVEVRLHKAELAKEVKRLRAALETAENSVAV